MENDPSKIEWDAKRFLSKNNYLIQTDAVKNYLIPSGNYKENLEWLAYAEEADILNVALFGFTAKAWRDKNPELAKKNDYRLIRELPSGRGFADIVFLPLPASGKPALIMELKYNKSAETAIQQIRDRHYPHALNGYSGEILLVGVSYDKGKNSPHNCVIEKLVNA